MASERTDSTRADPPVLTIADGDVWTCTCGNVAEMDGFYTVIVDATHAREVEPISGGVWDGMTYACARCGATYRVEAALQTTTFVGEYRTFEALP